MTVPTAILPALGWRMGAVLLALLLLPAMIYRFSPVETQLSLDSFVETIFYLGLLGGILPPVLAIGYFVTYKELVGCQFGHVYESILGQCPECAAKIVPVVPAPNPTVSSPHLNRDQSHNLMLPLPVIRPKANAWLVSYGW